MSNIPYLPVVNSLLGRGVQLEIGDPARPSVEVVTGVMWGTYFDGEITLVVTFADRNVEKPVDKNADPKTLPVKQLEPVREFMFKWIRTANIISVVSDANVMVNITKRAIKRLKPDPLYTDDLPQWSVLNNHLVKHIKMQLDEIFSNNETGPFRNDENAPITEETAFPPMTAVTSAPNTPNATEIAQPAPEAPKA